MITLCDGGNRLVSCSLDQTLKIFDVNTSTCIATLKVLALLALGGDSCLSIDALMSPLCACVGLDSGAVCTGG